MTFSLAEFHSARLRAVVSDCDFFLECALSVVGWVGLAGVMLGFDRNQDCSGSGFKTDFEG